MSGELTCVLAWRPFIDSIDAHSWWFLLLLPVALLVSLSWKSVRVDDIRGLPRAVGVMTAQVVAVMLALGFAAFIGLTVVLPLLARVLR